MEIIKTYNSFVRNSNILILQFRSLLDTGQTINEATILEYLTELKTYRGCLLEYSNITNTNFKVTEHKEKIIELQNAFIEVFDLIKSEQWQKSKCITKEFAPTYEALRGILKHFRELVAEFDRYYPDFVSISDIKQQAINETIIFFKEKHSIQIDKGSMFIYLNTENDYLKSIIETYQRQIEQGETMELLKELKRIQKDFDIARQKIRLGQMATAPKKIINDYCFYTFYILFNNSCIKKINTFKPRQNEVKKGQRKPRLEFAEYIQHEKREQIASAIKTEFKNEKGNCIRFMIEALKENDPVLFSTANRGIQARYEAMKKYFGTDIGSRQGIFDFEFSKAIYGPDYEAVKQRVSKILKSLKIT